MAKYTLLARSFIPRQVGGEAELLEAGQVIEFAGEPGSALELVTGSGKPLDTLANLKRKADGMKVKYPDNVTAEALSELIKAKAASEVR